VVSNIREAFLVKRISTQLGTVSLPLDSARALSLPKAVESGPEHVEGSNREAYFVSRFRSDPPKGRTTRYERRTTNDFQEAAASARFRTDTFPSLTAREEPDCVDRSDTTPTSRVRRSGHRIEAGPEPPDRAYGPSRRTNPPCRRTPTAPARWRLPMPALHPSRSRP